VNDSEAHGSVHLLVMNVRKITEGIKSLIEKGEDEKAKQWQQTVDDLRTFTTEEKITHHNNIKRRLVNAPPAMGRPTSFREEYCSMVVRVGQKGPIPG
jgi:DNA-binding SARP family transcriptional activator